MTETSPYSVLMSVYKNEEAAIMRSAVDSMLEQTTPPDEFVIVKDGPLPSDLDDLIDEYVCRSPDLFRIVTLRENQGLGAALNVGVSACKNELIARMDSDDYSKPDRMEKCLSFLARHPEVGMVGTQIEEFVSDYSDPHCITELPLTHESIVKFSKRRNPFRHPAVVYKKLEVQRAGSYRVDQMYFEDWDLFNRMISAGSLTANLKDVSVCVRVSPDFYRRRGGISYLRWAWRFKRGEWSRGYFSFTDLVLSFTPHLIVSLLPSGLRTVVYEKGLRRSVN